MTDPDPFDWTRIRPNDPADPLELTGGMPPPSGRAGSVPLRTPRDGDAGAVPGRGGSPVPPMPPGGYSPVPPGGGHAPVPPVGSYTTNLPVRYRPGPWRWVVRGIAAGIVLLVVAIVWLALTAPLSKSLRPPEPPSITLLAEDGTPIARRGAVIGAPVDAAKLPDHVRNAFVAIEDRRFYRHWGVDPRGIARAMFHNLTSDGGTQGGSTITQQLAKNAFLDLDRTMGRKFQEVLISFWLEAWLSKNEILSRYLSNVYFGDNVYGLSAAARHYFSCTPDALTVGQAAMLAGLVQAPSRLAPTGNLKGARARQALVVGAMVDAGLLDKRRAASVRPAVLHVERVKELPNGTYFADWVLPAARDRAGEIASDQTVRTTLDARLQKTAERVVARAGLKKAQVAMVVMRPDGRVVAMVGGKDYRQSPFNRATQARRQPGSTFKLFVYYAALKSGMTPDSMVLDAPVQIGQWKPQNSDGKYRGQITLREAFARSSNVAAARLIHQLGPARVIQVAREFGISTPIPNEASIALGTANVSLLELTAAYAGIAAGKAPVRPHGLPDPERQDNWFARAGGSDLDPRALSGMRDMLSAVVTQGTGGRAALSVDAYGKTGTTQDGRDVLFVGYANGLVVGVWVGNDDNSPNPGLRSSIPAGIWRDFMVSALGVTPPRRAPAPQPEEDAVIVNGADLLESIGNAVDIDLPDVGIDLNKGVEGPGFSVRRNGNGDIVVETGPPDLRPRQGDPVPQEGRDRPRQPGGEGN